MSGAVYLAADIGGTNTRIALGNGDDISTATLTRYRNAEIDDFKTALNRFLADHQGVKITAACIAVAGPVSGPTAKLTNHCWSFDARLLAKMIGCEHVSLVNDMGALARTIPALSEPHTQIWKAASPQNGDQSLVIGLGTGVNASALIGTTSVAAEIGHSALTLPMAQILQDAFGHTCNPADTIEDYLSGRGLQKLHKLATGEDLDGIAISNAAKTDGHPAQNTSRVYGALLAELIYELSLHYLPRHGVYLAGSVVRGMFETPAHDALIKGLAKDHTMASTVRSIPVSLITDDAAALLGCLEIAKSAA